MRVRPSSAVLAWSALVLLAAPAADTRADAGTEIRRLRAQFATPPDSAKPWAYWWWLNGHVSREGITADLEAMKRQGINGVLIFNAGGGDTPPGLTFMGPQWREMFRHALAEAGRLAMEVSVNLCDGWDAGGPWITPDAANKKLVHSETQVDGPGPVTIPLAQPPSVDNYYRDVAVLAIAEPPSSPVAPLRVSASAELGGYCDEKNWPGADAVDRDPTTTWKSGPVSRETGAWLLLEYARPLTARALHLTAPDAGVGLKCRLEASEDGRQFRPVIEFALAAGSQVVTIPETTAKSFRLHLGEESKTGEMDGAFWIWHAEGDPASNAPVGSVFFRRELTLPPGRRVARAVLTATADNSFTLYVNGRKVGGNLGDALGFHRLTAFDVTGDLRPGENVLAVAAENGGASPNPAGLIGRLVAELDDGQRIALVTDRSWRATRDAPAESWQSSAFDDRAWPGAAEAAPYGGGPWGRPALSGGGVELAEVWLLRTGDEPNLRPGIRWWPFKSANRSFWDYPKHGPAVLNEEHPAPDVCDVRRGEVVDLTGRMRPDGTLAWDMPAGRWSILRFGCTLEGQRTRAGSTVGGYEADMLSRAGIETHFKHLAEPLLLEAGNTVGRTLKFLHIDSYELGADIQGQQPTWSLDFREQFRQRRGYDLLPYLPAMARRVVDGREVTGRFLWDFRRTIGDLMAEEFFGRFAELAHARGVGVHAETGYGTYPHPHFDGLRCAGACDVTMGEFWHGTDIMSQFDPFCNVIRSVASAAHIYGRPIVQAEAFTSWNHFVEYPFALKAVGDEAFCDGLNRMVFHQYTHQPRSDVVPGWQYGAGTHIDRHITWWPMADAWFAYLARCQSLLQAGRFHADLLYFYGEGATRYVPGRRHVRPALPDSYDFDCINEEVLLGRVQVQDGSLALSSGMRYRLLVLPEERVLSPAVLRGLRRLLEEGATVLGSRPLRSGGLADYPHCDGEVRALADGLWGVSPPEQGERRVGKGRLVWGRLPAEVLAGMSLPPDFEPLGAKADTNVRFIHRTIGDAEVYFLSNQQAQAVRFEGAFRVSNKVAEVWDPVLGTVHPLRNARTQGERTVVPAELAASGSCFVVFRDSTQGPGENASVGAEPFPRLKAAMEMNGPWAVSFDPKWGGPERMTLDQLMDWTRHPLPGVRHYAGTAVYRRTFDLAPELAAGGGQRAFLDLGTVHNLARVRLNGRDLGVVWCAPWRVEVTGALRPQGNRLEIEVVNLWPNRLIGDAALPPEKRLTRTNVAFSSDQPLLPSGLLGPVVITQEVTR